MARIAVAMSGGVDSSTAAALLVEAGHEVIGLTLQLWDYGPENQATGRGRCCSPADIADARTVADRLGMPLYVFAHGEGFRRHIVEPFVAEYASGRTPSPCIRCNRLVKFDILWRLARGLDADHLATGHYARLDGSLHGRHAARPQLRKGRDHDKDQSYFLFDVPVARLDDVLFPLGALDKNDVRAAARRLDVSVADKPESFELCFIPDGDKNRFVEDHLPAARRATGAIRHVDGRLLGAHRGLHRYTVGQRRGLGLDYPEPLYVVDLEPHANSVIVGPRRALETTELIATGCNWVSIDEPREPFVAAARIRHRHREAAALVTPLGDDRVHVEFEDPQRGVAPGQGAVFFQDDLLLGGGWIERQTERTGAGDQAVGNS